MFQSSVDMDKKIEKQQQIYKRIKLLGTGSYGKAYLVKQIKTDQTYVIKQILMADMSQQQQENALRQAKILEVLSHPNIIKFKEVYRTSKMRLNIVMEFANDGDLATKIKQAKKQSKYFEETQILDWFTQICLGIKHIHDRKIIHRDLKAHNIFLTTDKIVKIGDFGVSRVLEKTGMNARTVVGSPYYLSPQIIQNKPYSFQTDIWSLGALLYEMCALSPPFTANNLQFLALKIVKGAYGQIPNHYSYDLRSLIKSMLNTDSFKRPNINKILTSKVISKRISSFLTESKRVDEFSHTVIHNKNVFQNNLANVHHKEQNLLQPPPNLINNEKYMQNKSQICLSNINFEIESQTKSRPFTPLIGQKKKGPNNFFNNNSKKPSKKNVPLESQDKNLKFDDLMQIKPSALQQKVKLPKVNQNPSVFQRRQSQACIKKNNSDLINLKHQQHQIPNSAFTKKRTESKQASRNNPINNLNKESENAQKLEQNLQNHVGKWKKPPKALQRIQIQSARGLGIDKDMPKIEVQRQIQIKHEINNNITQTKQKKKQINTKSENQVKNAKRTDSVKRIVCPPNKNSIAKNKNQTENLKKAPNLSKNNSRKELKNESVKAIEIISEEMKKKVVQERQPTKKTSNSKSSSKLEKEKKRVLSKKTSLATNTKHETVSHIKKPPIQNKTSKKITNPKGLQRLAQPPRLEFENTHDLQMDQPQKKNKEEELVEEEQQQVVEEQKCNSDRSQEFDIEEMYSHEEFQQYQQDDSNCQNTPKKQLTHGQTQEEYSDWQNQCGQRQRLSLSLSDSCRPIEQKNGNFNKMLQQMEHIKNIIALANGIIDTLPIMGDGLIQRNILELSLISQQVIREDDSDLQSVIHDMDVDDQTKVLFPQHCASQQNQKQQNESEIRSNASNSSLNNQTNTNLTLLSNQEHLQTLKMNLEELFGEENIIFIHQFLCQIIEKQGLDFNEKDVQRMVLFQKPQINPILLRKYFRLIVTVVIMEQQQNMVN